MRCEKARLSEACDLDPRVPRPLNPRFPGPEILVSARFIPGMGSDSPSWVTQIDRTGNLRQEIQQEKRMGKPGSLEMKVAPSPLTAAQMDELHQLLDAMDADRLRAMMRSHGVDDADLVQLFIHDRQIEAELAVDHYITCFNQRPDSISPEFRGVIGDFSRLWKFINALSPHSLPVGRSRLQRYRRVPTGLMESPSPRNDPS